MFRKKMMAIGLALAFVIPTAAAEVVLSATPAHAMYCYANGSPKLAIGPILGVKSFYGYGYIQCNPGYTYKITIHAGIRQTTDSGWTMVAKSTSSCWEDTGSCPLQGTGSLLVSYPFRKCVHNEGYQLRVWGWYNLKKGGTEYQVDPYLADINWFEC